MPGRKNPHHRETHRSDRVGWLRAGVLGANDGIVSTASLMIGVAATSASRSAILVAGLAGLAAGAMSMAAGEYVSVSSQRDLEQADIAKETSELLHSPAHELAELTEIYVQRGLDPALARQVATQLTEANALDAHLRDELGIMEHTMARPVQAAAVSAASFGIGAGLAVAAMALTPVGASDAVRIVVTAVVALILLATLGWVGGRLGGAPPARAAARVTIGGALAMVITAVIGKLIGNAV